MESALAIGGSRLSPVPGPEAFPPDEDPPGELPQADALRPGTPKRPPLVSPAPRPAPAALPKRAGGKKEAPQPPRPSPVRRRVAEGRVTEAPAPAAPQRVAPAPARPAPPKPAPAKPSPSARRVRRQRQVVIAAVAGFLAGLLVYRAFAPHEAPAPERPAPAQRAPEWPPASQFSPAPESSWPPFAGGTAPDSGYRPPAYPPGPSYPAEDYRPWGRTDGRSDRPRETSPASSGGYAPATSPYAPYVPAR